MLCHLLGYRKPIFLLIFVKIFLQFLPILFYLLVLKSVEIWAYGSRVDGTAHETSDLDLVLRSKDLKPIPTMELTDFELAVAESNIPILVQIFDWARIPESFHKNILNNYEILKPTQ